MKTPQKEICSRPERDMCSLCPSVRGCLAMTRRMEEREEERGRERRIREAGPEMYHALKVLVSQLAFHKESHGYKLAEAAIARAEGRAR